MRPTDVVRVVRFVLGAIGLLAPRRAAALWGADPGSDRTVIVARVLGARHLAQGGLLTAHPTRRVTIGSVVVDLLHGASMVLLATVSPRLRRPAATSACIAFALAGATAATSPLRGAGDGAEEPEPGPRAAQRRTPDVHDVEEIERLARQRAAELTHRSERVLAASTDSPMPSWSPVGATVLLVVGIWLLVGTWILSYPFNGVGHNTALRDGGFAVVVTLAALRLLVAKRSLTATGVAVLAGVLLVCAGALLGHSAERATVNEIICGGLVLVSALATLDRRRGRTRTAAA
jgi:hypothetical protein